MPNRIEKFASVTYIPGTPATPYQPAYCIAEVSNVRTMGVNRLVGDGGFASSWDSHLNADYYTWVLSESDSEYNLGLQAEN